MSAIRAPIASGWASRARVASAESPTTIALLIVPSPGISRSGIHRTSTTKLNSTTAWPSDIGTCRTKPECRTSHGASPSAPRTIMASETP